MNDKELLELAAKAAGLDAYWSTSLEDWQKEITSPYVNGKEWNPLEDDGDALRLGVKLYLLSSPVFYHHLGIEKLRTSDEYTATRRAIVRAAAEIGEAMK